MFADLGHFTALSIRVRSSCTYAFLCRMLIYMYDGNAARNH